MFVYFLDRFAHSGKFEIEFEILGFFIYTTKPLLHFVCICSVLVLLSLSLLNDRGGDSIEDNKLEINQGGEVSIFSDHLFASSLFLGRGLSMSN